MRTPEAAFMRIVIKRQSLRPNLQGEKQREGKSEMRSMKIAERQQEFGSSEPWRLTLSYSRPAGARSHSPTEPWRSVGSMQRFPPARCTGTEALRAHSPQGWSYLLSSEPWRVMRGVSLPGHPVLSAPGACLPLTL